MNKQLELFEGQEITITTDKGITLINLANTAKVLGLVKKDNKRGTESVRWKGERSIYDKLSKVKKNMCDTNVAQKEIINEVHYILDEIDNADDRTTIYMSRQLTSLLAMECHNENAMAYKTWLARLDEKYSKGELAINSQAIGDIAGQMTLMANNMAMIGKAMTQMQNYVEDSLSKKDIQIDKITDRANQIASMVGFKMSHTREASRKLKSKVQTHCGRKIWHTTPEFISAKMKVFKNFGVYRWEDIAVERFWDVCDYINEMEL